MGTSAEVRRKKEEWSYALCLSDKGGGLYEGFGGSTAEEKKSAEARSEEEKGEKEKRAGSITKSRAGKDRTYLVSVENEMKRTEKGRELCRRQGWS